MGCVICSSTIINTIKISDSLEYLCCNTCGYCRKNVSQAELVDDFERNQSLYYGNDAVDPFTEPYLIKAQKLAHRADFCERLFAEKQELLEIGPGEGLFLEWARQKGFECMACEQSPTLASALKRKGFEVVLGEFEAMEIPKLFDAVASFHIIEHVVSPLSHLERAFALTKSGGHMIVATPNANSWQHQLNPKLSVNFDTAHLHVFSRQSLEILANRAGWEVVLVRTPENASAWLRFFTRVVRNFKQEDASLTAGKYSNIASGNSRMNHLVWLFSIVSWPFRIFQQSVGRGSEIFLLLRKV